MRPSRIPAAGLVLLVAVMIAQRRCDGQLTKPSNSGATKKSTQEPRVDLSRRWQSVQLAVGHADVVMDMAFYGSLAVWRRQGPIGPTLKVLDGDLTSPLAFKTDATLVVKGDCSNDVSLPKGGVVHIYGDLTNFIRIAGQGEIVIAGRIAPGAAIDVGGIQHIFVGGELAGEVRSVGSLKIVVGGSLTGTVKTGEPVTNLTIHGDLTGKIAPTRHAGLLYLEVDGFASYAKLEAIARSFYTEFNASIASSDREPGFYPTKSILLNCCWTIQAKGRTALPATPLRSSKPADRGR